MERQAAGGRAPGAGEPPPSTPSAPSPGVSGRRAAPGGDRPPPLRLRSSLRRAGSGGVGGRGAPWQRPRGGAGGRRAGWRGSVAAGAGVGFVPIDSLTQERETERAEDGLASGVPSTLNDSPTPEEEDFAVDDEESDGESDAWELPEEVTGGHAQEQEADLFTEDWDLELKADQGNPYDAEDIQGCISQDLKPRVCCAPPGDMLYDPSWHHPPPLIPHYSKMVFETGQFDDAED